MNPFVNPDIFYTDIFEPEMLSSVETASSAIVLHTTTASGGITVSTQSTTDGRDYNNTYSIVFA